MACSGLADFVEELACPICFNYYDFKDSARIPKLLDCHHTFCGLCIARSLELDGSLKCFICRHIHKKVNTAELVENFAITDLLKNIQEQNDHEMAVHLQQEIDRIPTESPAAPEINITESPSGQTSVEVLSGNSLNSTEYFTEYQTMSEEDYQQERLAQAQAQEQARRAQDQARLGRTQAQEQARLAQTQAQEQVMMAQQHARLAQAQAQEQGRRALEQARLAQAQAQEQGRRALEQARLARAQAQEQARRAQQQARLARSQAQEQTRMAQQHSMLVQTQAQEQTRMSQQHSMLVQTQAQEQAGSTQQLISFQTAGLGGLQQQMMYSRQTFFCHF